TSGGGPFTGAVALTVGQYHACVLDGASQVWCWGYNGYGEIGDASNIDRPEPFMVMTATQVAAGSWYTCALLPDTTIACWGAGWRSRLGNGSHGSVNVPGPVLASVSGSEPFRGATAIAAAGVSCALAGTQGLMCWGDDEHGQI